LFRDEVQQVRARAEGAESREFVLKVAGVRETVTVTASPGYRVQAISSATRTLTPLRDVPQSVTVATRELIQDQLMTSVADVMRYVPGVGTHQGENNRDQVVIRGNNSSADFFLDGVRDDVQYYRDLYNLERVEALKGPNAMTFGRGGGGGVINRVTKEAIFQPVHEVSVQGGTYGRKRVAADIDQPLGAHLAFRLNGMYESSDSFRDRVDLERYAVNPTLTFAASDRTKLTFGYEHLHDTRVADRGISSFGGLPVDVDVATFFGNPDDSHVRANVDLASATVEHHAGKVTIRNRTLFGDYDRFYQNYVPGAVTADQSRVALSAYNNETARRNVFNQTDVTYGVATGSVRHTLLAGAEIGRQLTDNFRNSGFFNGTATSISVPLASPTIDTPVTYRQNATDADNHLRTNVAAAYVQDQIELSRNLQVLAGVRFDRFDLQYHNNRSGDTLDRVDDLVSPRAGVVFKPATPVSVYAATASRTCRAPGTQFSSLTTVTEQVEPEKFQNYEAGVKWDVRPDLSLTAAGYRLDRTNTRSTDPNDPTPHRPDGQPAHQRVRDRPQRPHHAALARRRRLLLSGCVRDQRHRRRPRGRPGGAGAAPHAVALEHVSGDPAPRPRAGRAPPHRHVRGRRQHGGAARLHAGGRRRLLHPHPDHPPPGQRREPLRRHLLRQRRQQHEHLPRLPARPARRSDRRLLAPGARAPRPSRWTRRQIT
jgi:catecholate siderophore receptor